MLDLSTTNSMIAVSSQTVNLDSFDLFIDGTFSNFLETLPASKFVLSEINRLVSDDPLRPLQPWISDGEPCSTNISPEWTLENVDTGYIYSEGEDGAEAVYACPVQGERLAVLSGVSYRFRGRFGLHRCEGAVSLTFFDAEGRSIDVFQADVSPSKVGGTELSDYAEVSLTVRSPADACALSVKIAKGPTLEGDDSFMFFAMPTLVHRREGAWSDGPPVNFDLPTTLIAFGSAPDSLTFIKPLWPSHLYANGSHDIELIERATGARLERKQFRPPPSLVSDVEIFGIQGSVLVGRTKVRASAPVQLSLWIDHGPAETYTIAALGGGEHFRLPLPLFACDGRPHLFQLRDLDGRLKDQFAGFGPDSLTPWSALVGYGGPPLPISRAPAMEYRYRALRDGLDLLAQNAESGSLDLAQRLNTLLLSHDLVVEGFERKRTVYPTLPFPAHPQRPKISIIVPAHNKFDVTYNCLASILLTATKLDFEVVVVDDGSSDETRRLSAIAPGVIVVRNEIAVGFSGACARGVQASSGEYLVFLNNDTEVTAGWLEELLFAFTAFTDVGLVGSKLIFGDGSLQEAGGIVYATGDPDNYGRGDNPRDPRFCYTREVDYVSGACMMLPRYLWEDVGGFSPEFAPAYFEDTDLAFKVRAAGRRVVYAPFSVVYHFEGLSNGTNVKNETGLKRYQEINRPKFKKKWSASFVGAGGSPSELDLIKDRGISRRAVLFDIETPRIDNDAGSYAALQEIRLLQSLGFKVTFAPSNLAYLGRHTELLQRLGVEMIYAPFQDSIEGFIADRIGEFDLVYITRYQMADRLVNHVRRAAPTVPIVCNVADLHFLRAIREAMLSSDHKDRMADVEALRRSEMEALAKVDLVLTYSSVEEGVIAAQSLGTTRSARIPWVVDPTKQCSPFAEREGVAFLGGFRHPPNVSAVEFFVSEVMPLMREKLPGVPFRIYGSSIPEHLLALAAEDVIFEGYVPDIAQVFDRCRVFVTPLRYGAGVKGKVLDSLAAGVPLVTSPAAAEALPVTDGIEVLIADKPSEWVEAITALYLDETRWRQMSNAMLSLVEHTFSFERGRQTMQRALNQVDLKTSGLRSALYLNRARP